LRVVGLSRSSEGLYDSERLRQVCPATEKGFSDGSVLGGPQQPTKLEWKKEKRKYSIPLPGSIKFHQPTRLARGAIG